MNDIHVNSPAKAGFAIKSERIEIGRYLAKTNEVKFELSTVAVPAGGHNDRLQAAIIRWGAAGILPARAGSSR